MEEEEYEAGVYKIQLNSLETGQPVVLLPVTIALDPDKGWYWHLESVARLTGFSSAKAALEGANKAITDLFEVMLLLGMEPSNERTIATIKFMMALP